DEIELHLHPSWQRTIVPDLARTFPNCQFFVSTHSPQVLGSVAAESVYLLDQPPDGFRALHPGHAFGRDTNEILRELMATSDRLPEIRQRLDEMFACIDAGDVAGA